MLTINRWRNWLPTSETIEKCTKGEPSKPPIMIFEGFEGTSFDESENYSCQLNIDLGAWREPFRTWLDVRCTKSSKCFGGFNFLLIDFCEWDAHHNGVACNCEIFKKLLAEDGYLIEEIHGTVLVSGLILREDYEAFKT